MNTSLFYNDIIMKTFKEFLQLTEATSKEPKTKSSVVDISHHKCYLSNLQESTNEYDGYIKQSEPYDGEDTPHIKHFLDMISKNKPNKFVSSYHDRIYDYDPYHNHELAEKHERNLNGEDYNNINTLVYGDLEHSNSGTARLNKTLIDAHNSGEPPPHSYVNGEGDTVDLDSIDKTLSKNKLDKKMTTYSGIGFNPHYHIGDDGTLHLPGYTSTSLNALTAATYAAHHSKNLGNGEHHILEIEHPEGSTGLYIGNNQDLSIFNHNEYIMPRNQKLKVDPTPRVIDLDDGSKAHIWSAKRI